MGVIFAAEMKSNKPKLTIALGLKPRREVEFEHVILHVDADHLLLEKAVKFTFHVQAKGKAPTFVSKSNKRQAKFIRPRHIRPQIIKLPPHLFCINVQS